VPDGLLRHTEKKRGKKEKKSLAALCQTAPCDIREKKNRKCLAQSLTELKCAVQESLLLHMWTEEGKISLNFFFSKNLLQNTHALCKTLLEDFFFFHLATEFRRKTFFSFLATYETLLLNEQKVEKHLAERKSVVSLLLYMKRKKKKVSC